MLFDLERDWFAARSAIVGRHRNSRAAAAIDHLTAAPLVSVTTLTSGLGMVVKHATALLLNSFASAGIAVEMTHRSKRRGYLGWPAWHRYARDAAAVAA